MAGRLRLGLIALALSGCGGAQDSAPNGTTEAAADAADNAEMSADIADNAVVDYGTDALENKADAIRDTSDPASPEDPPGASPEDPPGAQ